MHLILLGPPGSGKGTLAAELLLKYEIPHISTGDIFRRNIREKTVLGQRADNYLSTGALVPDDVTIDMVADRLSQPDCENGFLLDGFPRTLVQAQALADMPEIVRHPIDLAINVKVSDETILERLSNRRICSGCGRSYNLVSIPPRAPDRCDDCGQPLIQRVDDLPATIKQRLQTYHAQTEPLIEYYKSAGLLFEIDNEGPVGSSLDEVQSRLNGLSGT